MLHHFRNSAKFILGTFCFPFAVVNASAQDISLEEIWSGQFYPKSIDNIVSMKDGKYYTILTDIGIDKYSYQTFEKIETLIKGRFTDYHFSPDENFLLLEEKSTPIYRNSKSGIYTVYNLKTQNYTKVFDKIQIQEPTFSPDGSKIAFVYQNNIYYQDLANGKTTQVTTDGEANKTINGVSDWVYEEELGVVRQFQWSPDGKFLAFVRFDESHVKEVDIPLYQSNLYPKHLIFKYPKAGEENSKVSLHLYSLETLSTHEILLNSVENYYIIKIKFAPKSKNLMVLTSNRLQNKVDFSIVDSEAKTVNKLFSETSKTWIDTDNIFLEFLYNDKFIINSGRSGFNHLYLYSNSGKMENQLTQGNWEITEIYGVDKSQNIYFQSTEKGANNRVISSINIQTRKQALITPEDGTHKAFFSSDFSRLIDWFSTANTPPVYVLRDNKGTLLKTLEDNAQLLEYASKKGICPLEFINIPNGKNENLNAFIIKPKNFDPTKKYPVLIYVYGGPGVQTVNNSWDSFNYWWFQMLAQQGYIVVSIDGRGTGGRGENFKKTIYKQLGKLELDDQILAAQWLGSQAYVDGERIGIWGWSFGGYMTSLCMTKGEGLFKTGIAVAPVTNWRYYDTIYTERFLQTPQENPSGYDDNSPLNFAQNLQGNYLIIHGTADDNVHFQNSMEMINALVQQGKQFDMAIYPDKNHGIYGGKTRYQLYQKMTEFIKENL
ncbi:MAG: S9 family peptidase [Flavobacteriaceae bacterium]|jgi:dipeptidyl-peptidase-4|nr:S9 family peptidase [Flavobacteriaceae bacterium]